MDLKDARLIYIKGILFVIGGVISGAILLLEHPSLKVAALMGVCVWCFARAYYFAFYVIEHYVDGQFHYAGVMSFAKYLMRRRSK